MTIRNLKKLLRPRSVALIGASPKTGSVGHTIRTRLLAAGFNGHVTCINPKYTEIEGEPCFASLADAPDAPDLGIVVTPPQIVPKVIGELGATGARAAIVITAGLIDENGLRQAMLDAAQPFCLRILGPNCVGLQVPDIGLNASFAHLTAQSGKLALLSQSGAIIVSMLDWAEARNVGFSVVASMGDMADVDLGDMLDELSTDPGTRAILMYVEQVTNPRKFMSAARAAARNKPVIVVKSGRSDQASKAAASHTGALAGQDSVYDAAFRRAGIVRVEDLDDLFGVAEVLAQLRPMQSDRLAILTNGGGAGVLAADALASSKASFANLTAETIDTLNACLPATWSHGNPVDIIGDADPDRYRQALSALLDDSETDAVLVMHCPTGMTSFDDIAEVIIQTRAHLDKRSMAPKPVITCLLGEATAKSAGEQLSQAGLPVYKTPAQAIRGFSYLVQHTKAQRELRRTPPQLPEGPEPDRDHVRSVLALARSDGRRWLNEPEAKSVLAAYGIPTVPTKIADSPQTARDIAAEFLIKTNYVVLKILSPDITHKSDVGGVRLNIA
ncbi:MAG: acetate--CoA ligase family protein, partial [Pseudomonadota bacterium]